MAFRQVDDDDDPDDFRLRPFFDDELAFEFEAAVFHSLKNSLTLLKMIEKGMLMRDSSDKKI